MDPQPAWLAPTIIGGFIIVFPLFWCSICMLLSMVGGWSELAKLYPANPLEAPYGTKFTWQGGRVGVTSYKGTLNICAGPAGLHLSVMPLFRCGHPPLLIPWSALTDRQPITFPFGFGTAMQCTVGSPAVTTLVLPQEIFKGQP